MIDYLALCIVAAMGATWAVHVFLAWRQRKRSEEEWDGAPYVCPGCYSVDQEPCASYCVDAAIERDRQRDIDDMAWSDREQEWNESDGVEGPWRDRQRMEDD